MNHQSKIRDLIKLDKIGSTNDYAVELLSKKEIKDGTIIWAAEQTKGRGEGSNTWESEPGKNLTLTRIFRPLFLPPEHQFYLLQIISLGVYDYLRMFVEEVSIKWPNDLYVGKNKIAGILIENSIIGGKINYSIAGIGININQTNFSPSLENPISLKNLTNIHYKLEESLDLLNLHVGNSYQQLKEGNYEEIKKRYQSVLYKLGELNTFYWN